MKKSKVAFIGTGVMGSSVVEHLLTAGYEVTLFTRTKEKANRLIEKGATWAETASAATAVSDIIFTMVGYPADVESIYFGENGIFSGSREGQIIVDMTTSSPALGDKNCSGGFRAKNGFYRCPGIGRRYWCEKWYFINYVRRGKGSF